MPFLVELSINSKCQKNSSLRISGTIKKMRTTLLERALANSYDALVLLMLDELFSVMQENIFKEDFVHARTI